MSYWMFPGGLENTKDIPEAMQDAKDAGFEAIELSVGSEGGLNPGSTQKECEVIRKKAYEIGIEISSVASGLYWGANFSMPDAAKRKQAESELKKALKITSWLGTDALLVIPGAVDVFFDPSAPVVPYDEVMERSKDGLKKVLPTAEKAGVVMAVENVWNRFLLSPVEMRDYIDSFGSEYVGSYFDVGNALNFGYPEHWIKILGKRIARIHLKDFKRAVGNAEGFCDLLEGDVNWPAVMDALKSIGYDSYLTAEMIPLYQHYPETRIANTSNAMDAIMGRCC